MPIPVNKYNKDTTTTAATTTQHVTIQTLFSQIIQLILSSRLGPPSPQQQQKYCLVQHDNCCLLERHYGDNGCIIINILQKESDILLERWMMSFDVITTSNPIESQDFLSTLSNFIHSSPTKLDLYVIASLNNNTITCHSYNANSDQERMEFRSEAHLKAKRFHLPSLSLEVVYDENVEGLVRKPVISLQSLSSPTFMSWPKMQQQQQQQSLSGGGNNNATNETIHPLVTAAIPHSTLQQQQQQQHIPIIAMRRLSRLSLSAMQIDDEQEEEEEGDTMKDVVMQQDTTATSIPIPSSSSRMQYTTHHHHGSHSHHHHHHHQNGILRSTIAYSTSPINNIPQHHYMSSSLSHLSPNTITTSTTEKRRSSITAEHHHSLVGSFEESLLSGRMSSMPSKSIEFICQIGVLGKGKPSCPPHWTLSFQATYYSLNDQEGTPYVGSIDLNKEEIGYRIPPKGQLQVVIKNPNKTAVKLFLIPYDFTDMPRNTKTFLRQKSYVEEEAKKHLRYAIHLQFCRNEKKRIYLYKSMRIVFANRKAEAREKFNVVIEDPGVPKYLAL